MGNQDSFQWTCVQQIVIACMNPAKSMPDFMVLQNN